MFSLWLIPLYVLGFVLLLMVIFAVLGRIRGGKYLRPIVTALARAPVIGPRIRRLSTAALERQNPDLASAIRKLERAGVHRDPTRAQKAMSTLTAAERRAYLQAAGNPEELEVPQNRAMRRQAAKARKSS